MASPPLCRRQRDLPAIGRLRWRRQRQLAVDDGLELARADQVQQRGQVISHPAIGAADVELEGPDETQVLLGIEAGGGPASQDSTLPAQRLEGGYPGVTTGEVDNDVDTAIEAAPMRLAVLGVY